MAIYQAPTEDAKFILHDVLRIHEKSKIEGYADLTDDMTGAIFEEAGKIAADTLLSVKVVGQASTVIRNTAGKGCPILFMP